MSLALCDAERIGFADHLKMATHAAYGLQVRFDAYEQCKGVPSESFFGLTPREAYIAHSETYMKMHHGPRIFGKLFMRALWVATAGTVIVPDSGFREEALHVIDEIGKDNVTLFRLHRDGCDFTGDSRSYIDLSDVGVHCYDISNNATVEQAAQEIVALWR